MVQDILVHKDLVVNSFFSRCENMKELQAYLDVAGVGAKRLILNSDISFSLVKQPLLLV